MSGQLGKALAAVGQPAGGYNIPCNATADLGERTASGLYFYKLDAQSHGQKFVSMRKMVLIK